MDFWLAIALAAGTFLAGAAAGHYDALASRSRMEREASYLRSLLKEDPDDVLEM
jgi:hypothetical protein